MKLGTLKAVVITLRALRKKLDSGLTRDIVIHDLHLYTREICLIERRLGIGKLCIERKEQ